MEKLQAGCWLGLIAIIGLLVWSLIALFLELSGDLVLLLIAIISLIISTIAGLPRSIFLLAAAGALAAFLWKTRE